LASRGLCGFRRLVGMAVRGLGVFVPALAVLVSHGSVFLGLLVIAVLEVIGGLVMMMCSRVVVSCCVVVVLDGRMLRHRTYLVGVTWVADQRQRVLSATLPCNVGANGRFALGSSGPSTNKAQGDRRDHDNAAAAAFASDTGRDGPASARFCPDH